MGRYIYSPSHEANISIDEGDVNCHKPDTPVNPPMAVSCDRGLWKWRAEFCIRLAI